MKKFIKAICCSIMSLGALSANAQLPDGTIATDFTLTDINGNVHNLYSYLDAGKTVIIDISATWCGPCWGYHETHALKELYLKHGPEGTCSQDIIVLFIEGDTSTTMAHLTGEDLTMSHGDWVTGTPYPIIDLQGDTCEQILSNFMLIGFPSLFRICPDRKVYEFDYFTNGTPAKIEEGVVSCNPNMNDVGLLSGGSSMSCGTTVVPSFTFKNTGTNVVTGATFDYTVGSATSSTYTYTGTLGVGESFTVMLPEVTGLAVGSHDINVSVATVNGVPDVVRVNNCLTYTTILNNASTVTVPFTQDFNGTETFPYAGWLVINDDEQVTWTKYSNASFSAVYMNNYNYPLTDRQDELIIPPINLSGSTMPSLTFDVSYAPYAADIGDKLAVYVSKDCGLEWTKLYNKDVTDLPTAAPSETEFFPTTAADWRKETIDLSAYAGQEKVFVKFVGTNGYGNNLFIDNINVDNTTSIQPAINDNARYTLTPNPVVDIASIRAELVQAAKLTVSIIDIAGKEVIAPAQHNCQAGMNIVNINAAQLPSGIYTIKIADGNSSQFLKMIK